MNKYNDKGKMHGPWVGYHLNGKLWYKLNYVNGKLYGLSEDYAYNGKLIAKVFFI